MPVALAITQFVFDPFAIAISSLRNLSPRRNINRTQHARVTKQSVKVLAFPAGGHHEKVFSSFPANVGARRWRESAGAG
jgi:hypothetical protein